MEGGEKYYNGREGGGEWLHIETLKPSPGKRQGEGKRTQQSRREGIAFSNVKSQRKAARRASERNLSKGSKLSKKVHVRKGGGVKGVDQILDKKVELTKDVRRKANQYLRKGHSSFQPGQRENK